MDSRNYRSGYVTDTPPKIDQDQQKRCAESAPKRVDNLLGDIAERQHSVNMRICLLTERAENLASKIFGAMPKHDSKAVENADGVLYLVQQTEFQQENLSRLEEALSRLEVL